MNKKAIRSRYFLFGLCIAPILGAIYHSQTNYQPLLQCPVKALTGIPCPSCGMTRGFICLARGDLNGACKENLFSPLVFVAFLVASVHLLLEIILKKKFDNFYVRLFNERKWQVALVRLLFLYHALRLLHLYHTGELNTLFLNSPLGKAIAL